MKYKIFIAVGFACMVMASSCKTEPDVPKVKNIILLIGDGMGTSHIYAGMTAKKNKLNIEKFPVVGFQKTYSASSFVTDSGASGTAISSGTKTKNGRIAVDTSGNPVKTILEYAEDHGYVSGLVATSTITHATPASFIAHNVNRSDYEGIALDFLKTDFELIIGGGEDHFNNREDSLNLIDSFEKQGYSFVRDISELSNAPNKVICFTSKDANPPASERKENLLPDATHTAIDFLNHRGEGFFLMVEGSQIDWKSHDNNSEGVIAEVLDFDEAVGEALQFALINKETLVIVTADHETGGMGLNGGSIKNGTVEAVFTTDGHTGVMVPVFAYGPGAEKFSGIYENTDLFFKMMEAYGFKTE
jgi:alkaline phosphatase